jgi:hypothetical protein
MRFRKTRTAFSIFWLIACLIVIVLWVQSFHTADRLHGRLWGRESLLLAWQEGRFAAVTFGWHGAPIRWQWETRNYPVDDERSCPIGSMHHYASQLGFGWIHRPIYFEDLPTRTVSRDGTLVERARLEGVGPMAPMSFLVFLSGALAALPWIHWRFSLRTLLIAITLVAVVPGLVVWATK